MATIYPCIFDMTMISTWVIDELASGNNKEIMSLLISKEIYAEDIGKDRITKRQLKDTRI